MTLTFRLPSLSRAALALALFASVLAVAAVQEVVAAQPAAASGCGGAVTVIGHGGSSTVGNPGNCNGTQRTGGGSAPAGTVWCVQRFGNVFMNTTTGPIEQCALRPGHHNCVVQQRWVFHDHATNQISIPPGPDRQNPRNAAWGVNPTGLAPNCLGDWQVDPRNMVECGFDGSAWPQARTTYDRFYDLAWHTGAAVAVRKPWGSAGCPVNGQGPGQPFPGPTTTTTPPPPPAPPWDPEPAQSTAMITAYLTIDQDERFTVGGQLRPGVLTGRTDIRCTSSNAELCGIALGTVSGVGYELTLNAPSTYQRCSSTGQLDCDYRLGSQTAGRNAQRDVFFYAATSTSQQVRASVRNTTGTFNEPYFYWLNHSYCTAPDRDGNRQCTYWTQRYLGFRGPAPIGWQITRPPASPVIGSTNNAG